MQRGLSGLSMLWRSVSGSYSYLPSRPAEPPARAVASRARKRFTSAASFGKEQHPGSTVLERKEVQTSLVVRPLQDDPHHHQRHHHTTRPFNADALEAYKLGKIALPVLLQYVIGSSSHVINTSFVGHLSDPVLLSSMVLATSLSCATGYTVMNGVASASETLCGQAHGAGNFKALQDTLCRALLIAAMTCVPITLAWLNSEDILLALGQPEAIASGAARYLHLTLPALYLYSIHECVDKYLLSQRIVKPSLIITAITTALTPVFAWWFVVQNNMGLDGAAWAYVAVQACTTALGLSYLAYRELYELPANPPLGWQPYKPSLGAFFNWTPYLVLAVPAVLSYCMEGWATEVLIFISGMLDNAEVAVGVTGLALQFSTIVWLAAASIGSATSTRVANKLGRGDALGAKTTAYTALKCVLASQTLVGLAAYTWREPLLGLMTNNTEVVRLAMNVMPVLACCFIADGLNVVQGATLRGAGRQWWTAGLNIVGWWGVGVPLAYYLAIVQGGNVPGLWAGFATASALQSALQFVTIHKGLDWDVEVQRAQEMMQASGEVAADESIDFPDEADLASAVSVGAMSATSGPAAGAAAADLAAWNYRKVHSHTGDIPPLPPHVSGFGAGAPDVDDAELDDVPTVLMVGSSGSATTPLLHRASAASAASDHTGNERVSNSGIHKGTLPAVPSPLSKVSKPNKREDKVGAPKPSSAWLQAVGRGVANPLAATLMALKGPNRSSNGR